MMIDWYSLGALFAQGDSAKPASGGNEFFVTIMPLIAVFVLFYFLLIRPQRKEQSTREAMLSALKKNDRVLTIGGMYGTVANISADGQEVTLKVDDNTRIRMIRSSIQRVLSADGEADKSADTKTT
jgi:preprotein translocase subunit YajC